MSKGVRKYKKKPVVIEAIQLKEDNIFKCMEFIGKKPEFKSDMDRNKFDEYEDIVRKDGLSIKTLEGVMKAQIGDYIIKGVEGEFYPCKEEIFKKTYKEVNNENEKDLSDRYSGGI